MTKISITIAAEVDPARLPKRMEEDEDEALKRFVRWLVARRTEGPLVKIKMTEKIEFTIYAEPLGKQLPILDLVSRMEDDDIPVEEEEEDEEQGEEQDELEAVDDR